MSLGLGLPQPETGHLLSQGSQLGHPLLGGSKLGGHIRAHPGLFDKAVPAFILLAKESGFLLAASDKGLEKKMMVRT
jgi:hypothetical protein